jgi:hypothetical protein
MPARSTPTALGRAGAASAAGLAAIHLTQLASAFGLASYVGLLFLVPITGFGWVAVRLSVADDSSAWAVGCVLAAATCLTFVLSRTVGLPGIVQQPWTIPGMTSLGLELLLCVLATVHGLILRRPRRLRVR